MTAYSKHNQPQPLSTPNLEDWVLEYRELLINVAKRKVSDYQIAEDLVQDTFLAVHKSKSVFRGDCSEKTFLMKILNRKIIDFYRYRSRKPLFFEDPSSTTSSWCNLEAENVDPTALLCKGEFVDQIDKAVNQLPEKLKQVFILYIIDEIPADEVAIKLNISPNQVWVSCHRARKKLKDWFADEDIEAQLSLFGKQNE